jgi:hypothetical protein
MGKQSPKDTLHTAQNHQITRIAKPAEWVKITWLVWELIFQSALAQLIQLLQAGE